ncbi:MAG: bacteriohemerythrin [Fibrobacterota bacterium]
MDTINWNESYSVGVERFDEQHKRIIALINRLIEAEQNHISAEDISDTLDAMTRYSSEHFTYEEELLKEYDYPKLENQEREHKAFIKKTVNFCMNTMVNKERVPEEMLSYLREWWINHILKEDMEYKEYLTNKGVS